MTDASHLAQQPSYEHILVHLERKVRGPAVPIAGVCEELVGSHRRRRTLSQPRPTGSAHDFLKPRVVLSATLARVDARVARRVVVAERAMLGACCSEQTDVVSDRWIRRWRRAGRPGRRLPGRLPGHLGPPSTARVLRVCMRRRGRRTQRRPDTVAAGGTAGALKDARRARSRREDVSGGVGGHHPRQGGAAGGGTRACDAAGDAAAGAVSGARCVESSAPCRARGEQGAS